MDGMFDFINDFGSFEESFDDGITNSSISSVFDCENETNFFSFGADEDFSGDENNEFFGNKEDSFFKADNDLENEDSSEEEITFSEDNNDDHAFWENDDSGIEETNLSDQFLGATPWAQFGSGPFDDMDGDGIPNLMDFFNGPGAEPSSFLGTTAQLSDQMADYEDISFTDIFSNILPDFMPDPISSPQDGSTDFDRAVDNFFEMLDPTEHYHCQEAPNSCAVAVQTDILNDFGINVSEAEMRELGEEHGIFSEEGGTSLEDVGKLLELHGIEVERGQHFDINDLLEAKANGEKVIIGLDAAEIWNDPGIQDNPLETMSGGFLDIASAGHAVEFKGVVEDYDGQHYVVIDDPGHPYGHNVRIPLDDFDDAWDDFGHFAVITHTH